MAAKVRSVASRNLGRKRRLKTERMLDRLRRGVRTGGIKVRREDIYTR